MSSTGNFTLSAAAWTELADGSETVLISTRQPAKFAIHVGAAAPSVDTEAFHEGSKGHPVSLYGLVVGDKVFGRAHELPTNRTTQITVTKT